jgi:ureidoacrylate peracid hydrolase
MTARVVPKRTLAEKLVACRCALAIVDMVNDFAHPQGKGALQGQRPLDHIRSIIPAIATLADAARQAGALVVHVQHTTLPEDLSSSGPWLDARLNAPYSAVDVCMAGTWGQQIVQELQPRAGDAVVQKHRYGAFIGTNLDLVLRSTAIETVVCCGASTNVCVEATAREAFAHDYYVVLPRDACASWDRELHEASLRTAARRYAAVCDADEILRLWRAGDEERTPTATAGGRS